jgi:hypothetical protein
MIRIMRTIAFIFWICVLSLRLIGQEVINPIEAAVLTGQVAPGSNGALFAWGTPHL